MRIYLLLIGIICKTLGDDDPEIKIVKKGDRTEMHCAAAATKEIGFCTIFRNEKSCTAYANKDRFVKLSQCDEDFEGVIFNKMNAGSTCQIVIENTKREHTGVWICSLLYKSTRHSLSLINNVVKNGKLLCFDNCSQ